MTTVDPLTIRDPDPTIEPYLNAPTTDIARRELVILFDKIIEPIVIKVVSQRLYVHLDPNNLKAGGTLDEQMAVETYENACALVLVYIESVRAGAPPPVCLVDYTAKIAHHACDAAINARYPERAKLKRRLRYMLNHAPDLAVWPECNGMVTGYKLWAYSPPTTPNDPDRLHALTERPAAILTAAGLYFGGDPDNEVADIEVVFNYLLRPIALDRLVTILAKLWGIEDHDEIVLGPPDDDHPGGSVDPASAESISQTVERRMYLKQIWRALVSLPTHYAAAIILNLRDNKNKGVIALLPMLGVASVSEIAGVVGLTLGELTQIWDNLPMADSELAEILAVTRPDVIKFRYLGRRQLNNRVGDWNTD